MSNKTFLGKVGTTPKGEWSASTTYERLDWVTYQGSSYIALAQNTNSTPSDSNPNWMVAAKHGEFTEEQLEEFKEEVVADSKEEMDEYTDTKKGVLDSYTTTKEGELDTYTNTKKGELDTHTTQKISDFDSNATSKTGTFNQNASDKTDAFNTNASSKTTDFNDNATAKTTAFDNNASSKTTDFNTNASSKTTAFNDNATAKTNAFDENYTEKLEAFNQAAASIEADLTNIKEVLGIDVETYSAEQTYNVGDLVVHSNKIYECNTQITVAEAWDNTKWTEVDVLELIKNIDNELQAKQTEITELQQDNTNLLNALPEVTGEGSNIVLQGTSRNKYKKAPLPRGNSTQITTSISAGDEYDSPTPEHKQDIHNVSGDGDINIFDEQMEEGTINSTTGANQDVENRIRSKNYIEIPNNVSILRLICTKKFTTIALRFYNSNQEYLQGTSNSVGGNVIDIKIPTAARYFRFVEFSNDLTKKFKITKDLNSEGYSPYGMGAITEKIINKNIFNEETVTFASGVLDDNGNPTSSTTSHYTENYYRVKESTDCILSGTINTDSSTTRIYFYDKNKTWISRSSASSGTSKAFTTPENCCYIRLQVASGITLKTGDVQIEYGSTATSYTPHEEQTLPFTLASGQKMYLGDYLADDGIHHVRGEVVLDGTENWQGFSLTGGTQYYFAFDSSKHYRDVITCMSNYYKGDMFDNRNPASVNNIVYTYNSGLAIKTTALESTTAWKAFVKDKYDNNVPIIIEYELAEEVITPYTTTQQEQYEAIKKAVSYYEQTNITLISSDADPLTNVKAVADMNLVINEQNQAIVALGGVI